jgi:UDP-2,3-diacylglucosamine pyrophosphatase LpxH
MEYAMATTVPSAPPDDVYIVSDLHLSLGRPEGSRTFSRLESFFYDDVFERFIDHLIREQDRRDTDATFILGGDVFDFLVITEVPERAEALEQGIVVSRDMRRVGLGSSARHAAWKLARIVKGHPRFFAALGRWLAAGHRLVVVTGNHDAELYWERVRETLKDALLAAARAADPAVEDSELEPLIEFRQWFYLEPGRLYFEHGNQYEASNCFRYNLCPEAPGRGRSELEELDMPVGSLFVRYLFNSVRHRKPYVANLVSMEQYMSAMARLNLLEMLGVLFRRVPFFLRAARATRLFESRELQRCRRVHEYRLAELADAEGLQPASLKRIQGERAMPDGMSKLRLAESILRPVVAKILKTAFAAVFILFVWFLVFSLIHSTHLIASGVFGKASLTALLAVLTVVAVMVLVNRFFSRLEEIPSGVPPAYYQVASAISREMKVPCVVMGHTHLAEVRPLEEEGTFFANTGTWTALHGQWDVLWPGNRRFTFVQMRGDRLELKRWNDAASRPDEVFQFAEYKLRPADVIYPEDPSAAVHLGSPPNSSPPIGPKG